MHDWSLLACYPWFARAPKCDTPLESELRAPRAPVRGYGCGAVLLNGRFRLATVRSCFLAAAGNRLFKDYRSSLNVACASTGVNSLHSVSNRRHARYGDLSLQGFAPVFGSCFDTESFREVSQLLSAQSLSKYFTAAERTAFLAGAEDAEPLFQIFCLAFAGRRVSEALALTADGIGIEV